MLLATERLSEGPAVAHPSDQRVASQYTLWLSHARSYLNFLRNEDPRAANLAPQMNDAIDNVLSFFSTIDEVMRDNWSSQNPNEATRRTTAEHVEATWRAEAEREALEQDALYQKD